MKTTNMPEQVFNRRKRALERLQRKNSSDQRVINEINSLKESTDIAGNPRNFHSKKDNSRKAKIRQF